MLNYIFNGEYINYYIGQIYEMVGKIVKNGRVLDAGLRGYILRPFKAIELNYDLRSLFEFLA